MGLNSRAHGSQRPGSSRRAHHAPGGGGGPRWGDTPPGRRGVRAGVVDRVRRRAWGLSGRLIASYILVTLAVVVLVEVLVLGLQVPLLVNGTQLQGQVDATAKSYAERYPGGVPAGTVLGQRGQSAKPAQAQPANPALVQQAGDGTLAVPAITGPVPGGQAVTAVVAIAADGTVVASSAPALYPPGRPATSELPVPVTSQIAVGQLVKSGTLSTSHGTVLWDLAWTESLQAIYVQTPWPPGS